MAAATLVVPCYNEASRLDVRAWSTFSIPGHAIRFCFVNDGSTDDTARVLESMKHEFSCDVISLEKNVGKAEAVRRGMLASIQTKPDYVGFWDADLAAPLVELSDFVSLMDAHREIEIVFGSRVKLMGRTIERHVWRHYLGRFAATLISTTLRLPIYDTQCGAKLFRNTDLLARVFENPFNTKWLFDVEILARFLTLDPRGRDHAVNMIHELPLRRWIDVAGSKVKPGDFASSFRDLRIIKAKYRL